MHKIPNLISVVRLLLVPLTVWLLISGAYGYAFTTFVVAGVSDGLDGYLARRFDWRSRLGSYLDPLADKALLVSVFVTLGFLKLMSQLESALGFDKSAIEVFPGLVLVKNPALIGQVRGILLATIGRPCVARQPEVDRCLKTQPDGRGWESRRERLSHGSSQRFVSPIQRDCAENV